MKLPFQPSCEITLPILFCHILFLLDPLAPPALPVSQPKSLMEERADRNLDSLDEDPTQVAALKDKTFVSKSSLEVNKVGGES